MVGVREERRLGLELRGAAKPEPRDWGADAASARQTAWSAATMMAAASNSRQRATRPRAREPASGERARVAPLVGKRSARKPKDQFAPGPGSSRMSVFPNRDVYGHLDRDRFMSTPAVR
jgi:hypothetical protein